jgi:hypothetical protein
MENLSPLIAQLWTVLTARADALSRVWKGFANFPETLPRRIYNSVWQDLRKLESLLRRKILFDAQQIYMTLQPSPPKAKRARPAEQGARSPNGKAKSNHRIAPFRLDDGGPPKARAFQAPRILSYDAIMAMPARVKKPRAETLSTARLLRRLETFYTAINETDVLARKLAQRLADHQPPRLKPFKAGKIYKRWAAVFAKIDLIFAGIPVRARVLDTS